MAETSIQWTDHSINPIRARHKTTGAIGHYCEKIAPGCANCYASSLQKRFKMPSFGSGQKRDEVEVFLDDAKLAEVCRRKKPTKYFWEDMSDLFGNWVTGEWLARCFSAMDATPQHTHQVLTKRPERILRHWPLLSTKRAIFPGCPGPLGEPQPCVVEGAYRDNVWLGTSISDQATADAAIPELCKCHDVVPVLFLSIEPLLGPVDLNLPWIKLANGAIQKTSAIDWVIIGGESGPGARPCNAGWVRSIVEQCKVAGVPCFVKQLGSAPRPSPLLSDLCVRFVKDSKGGEMSEWPEDLRVRQFPVVAL